MNLVRKVVHLALLLIPVLPSLGCHCDPPVFDFYKNILRTDLICLAVCEGTGTDFQYAELAAQTAWFRILDPMTLLEQSVGDTVLVTGQDGLNCGESVSRFNPGDSVFLALGRGFYYEFGRDTFYLEGACGKYFLEVEGGKNDGLNTQQIKEKISYFKKLQANPSYQMFHPHREMLFRGEYENIRGLRIDSMSLEGDAQYFFNHNIHLVQDGYSCDTPFGPSWAGRKVIIKENGDHIFLNKNWDSILIKTLAIPGQTWRCYEGPEYFIEAEVEGRDTMSFLGVADSVKWISFQVYDLLGAELENELNQMSLALSKNHGVLAMLNFHLFPDKTGITSGYKEEKLGMYEIAGMTSPKLGLQNFGWMEIFGFAVGDEFHILDEYQQSYFGPSLETESRIRQTILKVIEADYSYSEFIYRMERQESIHELRASGESLQFIHDTIRPGYTSDPVFTFLPDEVFFEDGWAYTTVMTGGSMPSKTIRVGPVLSGQQEDSCWGQVIFDGCFPDQTYYRGLGGPYGSCEGGFGSYSKMDKRLVYYSKSWGSWGTPLIITGHQEAETGSRLQIYPNPASDHIMIKSDHIVTGIKILDNAGRVLLSNEGHTKEQSISLEGIKQGIYLIGVQVEGRVLWERFIVN